MNSLGILLIVLTLIALWVIRNYQVDLQNARHRVASLERRLGSAMADKERLLDELEEHVAYLTDAAVQQQRRLHALPTVRP